MQTVQSKVIPIQLSFDSGSTWRDLVCITNMSAPLAKSINEVESYCGTHNGQGQPKLDFTGEAVCDLVPDPDQISYDEAADLVIDDTIFLARVANPLTGSVGSLLYLETEAIFESVTYKGSANQVVLFDFSIKGQGVPTRTP